MATPRRRIIRPEVQHAQSDRLLQKRRSQLENDRHALTLWMRKLRRAFHQVEKLQQRITRLERQIARLEE